MLYFCREAIAQKTDVTSWEDQVSLFAFAVATYGVVDVVVANAGIPEVGPLDNVGDALFAQPQKPTLKTVDVNTTGLIYSG